MILGIIPARGGSKGLPGKKLRALGGVPLIAHTIRAAQGSRRLDDSLVSTDDPAIAEAAREAGARVETAVLLQPTSPLRTAEDIDACITRLVDDGADMCVSVVRPHDSPYFNMVEIAKETAPFARACSPLMREAVRRQDAPAVYALNGAVYAVRRAVLETLENQFRLDRLAVSEMPRHRSVDIDTAEDLELAEWLLGRTAVASR